MAPGADEAAGVGGVDLGLGERVGRGQREDRDHDEHHATPVRAQDADVVPKLHRLCCLSSALPHERRSAGQGGGPDQAGVKPPGASRCVTRHEISL